MILCSSILICNCGLTLVWGKHFLYYHVNSIFCMNWERITIVVYHFSMHVLGLMQDPNSVVKQRSQFGSHGKLIQLWQRDSLLHLTAFVQATVTSPPFKTIEQFTCIMYDNTISHTNVNDLQEELIPKRVKLMEKLQPTQNELLQHDNHSLYQASINGEHVFKLS